MSDGVNETRRQRRNRLKRWARGDARFRRRVNAGARVSFNWIVMSREVAKALAAVDWIEQIDGVRFKVEQ